MFSLECTYKRDTSKEEIVTRCPASTNQQFNEPRRSLGARFSTKGRDQEVTRWVWEIQSESIALSCQSTSQGNVKCAVFWVLHEDIYYSCIHSLEIFKRTEFFILSLSRISSPLRRRLVVVVDKKLSIFTFVSHFVSFRFFFLSCSPHLSLSLSHSLFSFENKSRQHMRYIIFHSLIFSTRFTTYVFFFSTRETLKKISFLHVFFSLHS